MVGGCCCSHTDVAVADGDGAAAVVAEAEGVAPAGAPLVPRGGSHAVHAQAWPDYGVPRHYPPQ